MRVFRPVVQSLVLSVFNVQSQVPVCRSVALEFVGVLCPWPLCGEIRELFSLEAVDRECMNT